MHREVRDRFLHDRVHIALVVGYAAGYDAVQVVVVFHIHGIQPEAVVV